MYKYSIAVLLIIPVISIPAISQSPIKIAVYNLLNYPGTDAAVRNPYFRTVINSMDADVLVVNEINTQSGVNSFLVNVLNFDSVRYSAGDYIDGFDTDNAIFYRTSKITFLSNTPIHTNLRDISEFKIMNNLYSDTLRIYAVHLKAGTSDSLARGAEIDSLRNRTNQLANGSDFLILGDFNIYSANETAYRKLLKNNPGDDGNFYDHLTMPGIWNTSSYSPYHTQSTRTRSFGSGATGGLDDRFDMILYSGAVRDPGGIKFMPESYTPFGNDGNHYNDSINKVPNTAVPQATANALHYASDHLPVYAVFEFGNPSVINVSAIPEGIFNVSTGALNRSDTLKLILRESYSPYSIVDSAISIIDSLDFTASFIIRNTHSGNYFFEVRTANTIETWSKTAISFRRDSINTYDFTVSASQAFGDNEILKGNKYCIYSGDVDNDGIVSLNDILLIYNEGNNFTEGYKAEDLNADNLVDLQDVLIAYNNSANFVVKVIP